MRVSPRNFLGLRVKVVVIILAICSKSGSMPERANLFLIWHGRSIAGRLRVETLRSVHCLPLQLCLFVNHIFIDQVVVIVIVVVLILTILICIIEQLIVVFEH